MNVARLFKNLSRLLSIYPTRFFPRLRVQYTSSGKCDNPGCNNPKCPFKPNKGCCPNPCCPPRPGCPNPYCPCPPKPPCCPSDPCCPPKPPCPCPPKPPCCPPNPCCPPKPPCPCPPKPPCPCPSSPPCPCPPKPCPCPPSPPCCPPDPCCPSKPPCPCPPKTSGPGPLIPPCCPPDPCCPPKPPKPEPFCPPKPPGRSKNCAPHTSDLRNPPPRDLLNRANKSGAEARKILESYKSPAPEKLSEPELSLKTRSKEKSRSGKDGEKKKKKPNPSGQGSKSYKSPKKDYQQPNWTGVYNSIPNSIPVGKSKVSTSSGCSVCGKRSGTCLCSCPDCKESTYRCTCQPAKMMSAVEEKSREDTKLEINQFKAEDGACPSCLKKTGRCFCPQAVDKKSNIESVKSKSHLAEPSPSNGATLTSALKFGTSHQPPTASSGARPPVTASASASLLGAKKSTTSCQLPMMSSWNDLHPTPHAAEPVSAMSQTCAPPPCYYQKPQPQFSLPPCRIPQPSFQFAPSCKKEWGSAPQTCTSTGSISSPPCCKIPEAPRPAPSSSKKFEPPKPTSKASRKKSKPTGLDLPPRKKTRLSSTISLSRKKSKPCNVASTRRKAKPLSNLAPFAKKSKASCTVEASPKRRKPSSIVGGSRKETKSSSAGEVCGKKSQPIFFPAGNYKVPGCKLGGKQSGPSPSPPPLRKKLELEAQTQCDSAGSQKSDLATKASANKLFPITLKKIITLRSLFFKTSSTPPKQNPPPSTRSFCTKTPGASGKPSDSLPKKDSSKKIPSRSPPLCAAEPIYKKPTSSCGKAEPPCSHQKPPSPCGTPGSSSAPPTSSKQAAFRSPRQVSCKQREAPLGKCGGRDSSDPEVCCAGKPVGGSSSAPLCKGSATPVKKVVACCSKKPPRSCKSAPCTDGRSSNRAEDDEDPCGDCRSYTPRIPEEDLLCQHPHVFRPPTAAEQKALRLYFGDCYQNKEYYMYGKNSYLDLQLLMMNCRQPQPKPKKPVPRVPCFGHQSCE